MEKKYKKILLFGFIISAAIILHITSDYITFENFKTQRQQILTFVKGHYIPSLFFYILLYIFATAVALPVGALLTLIGGFLFGAFIAILATNIGATIGGTITFLLVRYFLGNTIQKKYHTQLSAFNTNIARYGANYLLLARLLVFIPFFLVNICAGLTTIPLRTFAWTTSLGIIPASSIFAYAGKQISTISHLSDVFSLPVIIAFILLIALGLISLVVKKYMLKNNILNKKELI